MNFRQGSIKLKFNWEKIQTNSQISQTTPNSSQITASWEAGRRFTSKRQMKTAAVKSAKDGMFLSCLDNLHPFAQVVLDMRNWKLS